MRLRLPIADETRDAPVLMIASVAMETGGANRSQRAIAAVGAAAFLFIPMTVSQCLAYLRARALIGVDTKPQRLGADERHEIALPLPCRRLAQRRDQFVVG